MLTALETKMAERIKLMEDSMKQHQAYIQNVYDAKPEDARILTSCLKHLDEEVGKVKVAMVQGMAQDQKVLGETKQMVQSISQELRSDVDGKIGQVTGVGTAQQKQQDNRIAGIELRSCSSRPTSRPDAQCPCACRLALPGRTRRAAPPST